MSHQPYVPEKSDMKEFTLRAVLIGLVLTVILGAANAYLGLRAGMTIAATYPAAVIGMAVLKIMKGSILEENIARTIGSIGESIAAGAIFTIPAFVIAGAWTNFNSFDAYIKSSMLMFVGGLLGILFVTFLRRVMVTDPDLVFPESVAAAEIHKAGQKGSQGSRHLFQAMGLGALLYSLGVVQLFAASKDFIIRVGRIGASFVRLGAAKDAPTLGAGGTVAVSGPGIFPAYIGVGYIIGPRLAALNFAGGVLSWGLFVPLLTLLLAPQYAPAVDAGLLSWADVSTAVFQNIVKTVAIGGMLMSAAFTLFRMRKSLFGGISRSINDVKKAASSQQATLRTDKDINIKIVFSALLGMAVVTFIVYWWFMGFSQANLVPALAAALVMLVAGFFFAAVSGYLVGLIGSSNNPISGLTLSTLVIAAILMVILGAKGIPGVTAVLAVAVWAWRRRGDRRGLRSVLLRPSPPRRHRDRNPAGRAVDRGGRDDAGRATPRHRPRDHAPRPGRRAHVAPPGGRSGTVARSGRPRRDGGRRRPVGHASHRPAVRPALGAPDRPRHPGRRGVRRRGVRAVPESRWHGQEPPGSVQ